MEKLKKDLEVARREKSSALRRLDSLAMECVALQVALEEADAANNGVDEADLTEVEDDFAIREGGRGRSIAEQFVQHVRCLMATGSSARSCREQLLLSAMYFVKDKQVQETFMDEVPTSHWFNKQPPKGLSPRECHYVATSVPRTAGLNERQKNESEPIAAKRTVRTSVECWGVTNDRELSGII